MPSIRLNLSLHRADVAQLAHSIHQRGQLTHVGNLHSEVHIRCLLLGIGQGVDCQYINVLIGKHGGDITQQALAVVSLYQYLYRDVIPGDRLTTVGNGREQIADTTHAHAIVTATRLGPTGMRLPSPASVVEQSRCRHHWQTGNRFTELFDGTGNLRDADIVAPDRNKQLLGLVELEPAYQLVD